MLPTARTVRSSRTSAGKFPVLRPWGSARSGGTLGFLPLRPRQPRVRAEVLVRGPAWFSRNRTCKRRQPVRETVRERCFQLDFSSPLTRRRDAEPSGSRHFPSSSPSHAMPFPSTAQSSSSCGGRRGVAPPRAPVRVSPITPRAPFGQSRWLDGDSLSPCLTRKRYSDPAPAGPLLTSGAVSFNGDRTEFAPIMSLLCAPHRSLYIRLRAVQARWGETGWSGPTVSGDHQVTRCHLWRKKNFMYLWLHNNRNGSPIHVTCVSGGRCGSSWPLSGIGGPDVCPEYPHPRPAWLCPPQPPQDGHKPRTLFRKRESGGDAS